MLLLSTQEADEAQDPYLLSDDHIPDNCDRQVLFQYVHPGRLQVHFDPVTADLINCYLPGFPLLCSKNPTKANS